MKNKVLKRMVAVFLSLSIIMCLSACSGKDGEKQSGSIDKNCKVGDYITFGTYEQDNDTLNGKEPIEWLVLDKKDGKVFVISKYALDCKSYNDEYEAVTWETCALRAWLNNEFINEAFSSTEQEGILISTVSDNKNPVYDTDPGKATQDKVFLLSINEAEKYFSSANERQCKPTDYAVANGVKESSGNGNCWWWLRSPGNYQSHAAGVCSDGSFSESGYTILSVYASVRPAMWINF